jgi:hypothetical protein
LSDLEFRLLEASESSKLALFVEKIYGKTYPNDLLYHSNKVSQIIENKLLICSGAFDGDDLVGHLATSYEAAEDITGDGITALVLPEYRGQNVMSQLSAPMWADYESRKLAGLHLYGVTIHDASQRKSLDGGAVVTGLLTHDWPGDYRASGFEPVGLPRMPIVTMFMRFHGSPMPARDIWVPERHQGALNDMYRAMGAERTFQATERGPVGTTKSRIIEKPAQQQATLRIDRIGTDAQKQIEEFLGQYETLAAQYLDIPLTDAAAKALIEDLEQSSWLFGCLLPERQNTDYLRMQKVEILDNWGSVVLDPRVSAIRQHITGCA